MHFSSNIETYYKFVRFKLIKTFDFEFDNKVLNEIFEIEAMTAPFKCSQI